MSDFNKAFEIILQNEGGFVFHEIEGDLGGATYAGISYKNFPDWKGWNLIDKNKKYQETSELTQSELTQLVKDFYKINFWDKIKGDEIRNQKIAIDICDFAVNAGVKTAIRFVQQILKIQQDGIIGNDTITKLNGIEEEEFIDKYIIKKIKYYVAICNRNSSQKKFLLGWINRTLKGH